MIVYSGTYRLVEKATGKVHEGPISFEFTLDGYGQGKGTYTATGALASNPRVSLIAEDGQCRVSWIVALQGNRMSTAGVDGPCSALALDATGFTLAADRTRYDLEISARGDARRLSAGPDSSQPAPALPALPEVAATPAIVATQQPVLARQRGQLPDVSPGLYSAVITCPGVEHIVANFYVLPGRSVTNSKSDKGLYQHVRVEMRGYIFTSKIFLHAMDGIRVSASGEEVRPPSGSWATAGLPDSFDFEGDFGAMRGKTYVGKQHCPFQRIDNPAARPYAEMSYPLRPPSYALDHSEHRDGVPSGFRETRLAEPRARSLAAAVRKTVEEDAESWRINALLPAATNDIHFFTSSDEPKVIYVWTSYKFNDVYGNDMTGEVAARVEGNTIRCLKYRDRTECEPPRPSMRNQMASLGKGKVRLGPIAISAKCFRESSRLETRTREVIVYASRKGDVDKETVHDTVQVPETIFVCASQKLELQCVARGMDQMLEWALGSGSTRDHAINLVSGQPTSFSTLQLDDYNRRIQDGSCVRSR